MLADGFGMKICLNDLLLENKMLAKIILTMETFVDKIWGFSK